MKLLKLSRLLACLLYFLLLGVDMLTTLSMNNWLAGFLRCLGLYFYDIGLIDCAIQPEDPSDSVTIKDVNKKLTGIVNGFAGLGVLVGGGFAIKTVVNAVPHPAGKVMVGSVGLSSLFLGESLRRAFNQPGKPPGSSSFCAFITHLINESPSGVSLEVIESCKWMGPLAAESVLLLLYVLCMELCRKQFLKWLLKRQSFQILYAWFEKRIPVFFTKRVSKGGESVSQIYLAIVSFLLLLNILYLLSVFVLLVKHMGGLPVLTLGVKLSGCCFLLAVLLVFEIFGNKIFKDLLGFDWAARLTRLRYVGLLVLVIAVVVCYLLYILTKVLFP